MFPYSLALKNFVIATRQVSRESWEEHQAGAETRKVTSQKQELPKAGLMPEIARAAFILFSSSYFSRQTRWTEELKQSPLKLSSPAKVMIHLSVRDLCPFLSCPCLPKNWRLSKKKRYVCVCGGGMEASRTPTRPSRYKDPSVLCFLFVGKRLSFLGLPQFQRADSNSWGLE